MLSGCRIGNRRLKSALRRREAILVGAGISDVCQGWCHPLGLGTGPDDEIGLKSETPPASTVAATEQSLAFSGVGEYSLTSSTAKPHPAMQTLSPTVLYRPLKEQYLVHRNNLRSRLLYCEVQAQLHCQLEVVSSRRQA